MTVYRRRLIFLFLIVLAGLVAAGVYAADWWMLTPGAGDGVFEVKPYIQLGDAPTPGETESLALLWQTADREAGWSVEVRAGTEWVQAGAPTRRRVDVAGLAPFRLYRVAMTGLTPGRTFSYRVLRDGVSVFGSTALARKPAGRPQRFVAFGDCGANTWDERRMAYQASLARPDYVVITGDIVYMRGRVSEYLANYFPVYNSDRASRLSGAPLARSVPFLAAPGNHDLVEGDFGRISDAFAYFYYWDVPQNGPLTSPGVPGAPLLSGPEGRRRAFLDAVGPAFPRSANYSFDYGDVHWTVLDSNPHADWTDPTLLGWLKADLQASRDAPWRFVTFHHPPFNSSHAHFDDQRMRVLAPVFEAANVQVVFSGHVHNYQRTYPLKFRPTPADPARPYGPGGRVEGRWSLDTAFDGATRTRPDGVIYLVTGAGGARLYDTGQGDRPGSWQPFTHKFISKMHSMTVVDVTPGSATVRQVSSEGAEIDRFVLTR